jgi:hypothetical protein
MLRAFQVHRKCGAAYRQLFSSRGRFEKEREREANREVANFGGMADGRG